MKIHNLSNGFEIVSTVRIGTLQTNKLKMKIINERAIRYKKKKNKPSVSKIDPIGIPKRN